MGLLRRSLNSTASAWRTAFLRCLLLEEPKAERATIRADSAGGFSGEGLEIEAVSARSTPTWAGRRPGGPTTRPAAGSLIVLKITFARTQVPRKGEEPPLKPKDDASPIKPRPLVRSPRCRRDGRAAWSNRTRL